MVDKKPYSSVRQGANEPRASSQEPIVKMRSEANTIVNLHGEYRCSDAGIRRDRGHSPRSRKLRTDRPLNPARRFTSLHALVALAGVLVLPGCYTVNTFVDAADANPGDGICARSLTATETRRGGLRLPVATPEQEMLVADALALLSPDDLDRLARGDLSPARRPELANALAAAEQWLRGTPPFEAERPGDFTPGEARLCTLRAAIMEANAHPWKSVITVPPGTYNLTLPVAEGGGPLAIERSMRIQGSGAAITTVDGQNTTTVFYVDAPFAGDVEINHLTVRNGNSQAGGGVYIDQGTVELEDLIVHDNFGFTGGGGLVVNGDATVYVRRTAFTDNFATGAFGGAIWNVGELWVYDSTLSGNDSNRAGAIHNSGSGALNLRNVTISGNLAHSDEAGVGGIRQWGFAVLNNVTITNNEGIGTEPGFDRGGGIYTLAGATTVMKNSIVAGNNGNGGPDDCIGALSGDSQYNLIGVSDGCTITSHLNTYILDEAANLGVLSSNGGPTMSHMPAFSSLARDAGYSFPPPAVNACEARDQRGVPRPQGDGDCDMGAVEYSDNSVFVSGFMLVNAATNTDIRPLLNDDWLVLAQLPPQLSVRAVTSGVTGSVVFDFDGDPEYRTENAAPYSLGGDAGGDYAPVALNGGAHLLTATPFAAADGAGQAGPGRTIRFNVLQVN